MPTLLDLASYVLAVLALLASLYKTINAWLNLRSFNWSDVDRTTKKIIHQIERDGFIPDVIVGIGRGGCIVGALISGNLRWAHKARSVPVLGVDRLYEWRGGMRIEVPNRLVDFTPLEGKTVLLVAGDIMTGGTMRFFMSAIEAVNARRIRTACLVRGATTAFQPDYFGRTIAGDFRMPWMYRGHSYIRDSRRPDLTGQGEAAGHVSATADETFHRY